MKFKYIFLGFIVLALLASCAKPPIAEMDSAKEAVFRAENDEAAVLYGGGSLSRARDALRRMQVEADSKRYDAAKTHAAEAIAAAERAIADGKTGVARAKSESESLISGLRPAIEETERNINGARYSQLNLDYGQMNRELNNARETTDQAEVDHAMGRYQNAIEKGSSVRATLGAINQRIADRVPRKKS
jgi:flagellin-like hook-associated protein FlgL